jgi:hypothetical protein
MSFNKRYLTKEVVINMISKNRFSKYNSDILIMDKWSSKFYDNYNKKEEYNLLRRELINETKFYSNLQSTTNHSHYDKLKSLSNIYENLIKENEWVDVLLTFDILGNKCLSNDNGKFNFTELKKIAIKKIEQHFDGQ